MFKVIAEGQEFEFATMAEAMEALIGTTLPIYAEEAIIIAPNGEVINPELPWL